MGIFMGFDGLPELPTSLLLSTTGRLTVYTNGNPADSGKRTCINSIAIANSGNAAKKVSLEYSQDAITYFLFWRGSIGADGAASDDMPGLPLILMPGGILAATAETANVLTVTTQSVMMG